MKTKLLLSATLLLFIFMNTAAAIDFQNGTGTTADPYRIETAEQLKLLNDDAYLDKSFVLENALEIPDAEWTPIGSSKKPFTGNFDGAGHTITFTNPDGVRFIKPEGHNIFHDAYGFFGNVENQLGNGYCEFENIHLVFIGDIEAVDSNGTHRQNFGALAGNFSVSVPLRENTTNDMINCSVEGKNLTGGAFTGGLCGLFIYSDMENCTAAINVTSTAVSSPSSVEIRNGTGGLVALSTNSEFSNCSASGNVEGEQRIGGLIGTLGLAEIRNCYATGDVHLTGTARTARIGGGLIGHLYNTKITDCYATGNVLGNVGTVGGLCGSYSGQLKNEAGMIRCYATGSVEANDIVGGLIGSGSNAIIEECFSTGEVTSYTTYAGGLMGYSNDTRVTSSFSTGDIYGDTSVGGLAGYAYHSIFNTTYATGDVKAGTENAGGLIGNAAYYTTVNNSSALNNHTSAPANAGRVFGKADNSAAYFTTAWENMTNMAGTYEPPALPADTITRAADNRNGEDISSFDVWNSYPENELGRWDTACWGEQCWRLHDYTDFRLPVFQWQTADFEADASHLNYTLPEEPEEPEEPTPPKPGGGNYKKTRNNSSNETPYMTPDMPPEKPSTISVIAGPALIVLLFMVAIAVFSYRRYTDREE